MNQQGVTFLEIVVVIAILMITSALVAPSIQDWRQKRALESDYLAVLAHIDYLNSRKRGVFIATGQTGVEGSGAPIDIKIGSQIPNANLKDYRVLVNQSTGFIQKYRGSITDNTWLEVEK